MTAVSSRPGDGGRPAGHFLPALGSGFHRVREAALTAGRRLSRPAGPGYSSPSARCDDGRSGPPTDANGLRGHRGAGPTGRGAVRRRWGAARYDGGAPLGTEGPGLGTKATARGARRGTTAGGAARKRRGAARYYGRACGTKAPGRGGGAGQRSAECLRWAEATEPPGAGARGHRMRGRTPVPDARAQTLVAVPQTTPVRIRTGCAGADAGRGCSRRARMRTLAPGVRAPAPGARAPAPARHRRRTPERVLAPGAGPGVEVGSGAGPGVGVGAGWGVTRVRPVPPRPSCRCRPRSVRLPSPGRAAAR